MGRFLIRKHLEFSNTVVNDTSVENSQNFSIKRKYFNENRPPLKSAVVDISDIDGMFLPKILLKVVCISDILIYFLCELRSPLILKVRSHFGGEFRNVM